MKLEKYNDHNVDLTSWGLPGVETLLDKMTDLVKRAASEAIEISLKDDGWGISFPAEWGETNGRGDPTPEDPMLIAVSLPLGNWCDNPEFSCSLRQIVQDIIDDNSSGDGKIDEDQGILAAKRLSAGFRSLSDMLDKALE